MTCEEEKKCLKPKPEKQLLAKEEEKNLIVDQLLDKYASYWTKEIASERIKTLLRKRSKTMRVTFALIDT